MARNSKSLTRLDRRERITRIKAIIYNLVRDIRIIREIRVRLFSRPVRVRILLRQTHERCAFLAFETKTPRRFCPPGCLFRLRNEHQSGAHALELVG